MTEVKASEFGAAIRNAKEDVSDPVRAALIVQRFVDDLYVYRGLGPLPAIQATVTDHGDRKSITWNVSFDELARTAGPGIAFHSSSPLAAAATTTKLLWSSATLDCDLLLGSPLSSVVGDKLHESASASPVQTVIQNLKDVVEFPDVRRLVNAGELSLRDSHSAHLEGNIFEFIS